ncbi:hypothetical protein R1sor_017078 [Riccia sorocarpa]|uniref:Uncharacterized protein n=1 Tax=Riccia sorocarpa TaxID=122646 RepID=A0ABD3I9S7_9MARC
MIEKFITSAKNFKLLEREAIKESLEAGVFGDIEGDPNLYLPHPEIGSKKKPSAPVVVEDDEESMDEQDFFKEVTGGRAEIARLWEENKKKGAEKLSKKRPHVPEKIASTPPPRAAPAPAPVDNEFSSGDEEQSSSGNESCEAEPLSDAPGPSKTQKRPSTKLKTLK